MPRRSGRSKITKEINNNASCNVGEKALPSSLESYFGPNELKKQLAEALKETTSAASLKSKTAKNNENKKRESKNRKNNKVNLFRRQFGGGKSVLLVSDKDAPKMVYADVVRNSILNKLDLKNLIPKNDDDSSESMVTSKDSNSSNSTWTSESGSNSLEQSCDTSLNESAKNIETICGKTIRDANLDNKDASDLSDMLAKLTPETLQELDEATWEVVSVDDWSQCGSDIMSEDQFQLLSDSDGPVPQHAADEADCDSGEALSLTNNQSKKRQVSVVTTPTAELKNNKSASHQPEKCSVVSNEPLSAQPKKKKVIVTRKYIGGPDFAQKMEDLNFENKGLHQVSSREM